jgi:putative RecB family exonuclease
MVRPEAEGESGRRVGHDTPYLSHSRINRYLECPEQYRLYYIENLRPRVPSASLVFGKAVHEALAALFQTGEDPVARFSEFWERVAESDVAYGRYESWEKLRDTGEALLERFVEKELSRIGQAALVEAPFELDISVLELPLVGVIDLVAEVDGERTVVDFKTSGSSYPHHQVELSDQLNAYQLAVPDATQAALCVLVKTKQPKIEWHFRKGSSGQLLDYLRKAGLIARDIAAERFYKRPGRWCTWCDFLPVCMRDERKVEETLVRIDPSS